MRVFKQMLGDDKSREVSKLLDSLTCHSKAFPDCPSIDTEDLTLLKSVLTGSLDLEKGMGDLLTKMMSDVSGVMEDKEGDLALIGEAWTSLGLLFVKLLSPQGPVDPMEKNRAKLNIAVDQVHCYVH